MTYSPEPRALPNFTFSLLINLAFLAMAQQQLGHKDQAEAALTRTRLIVQQLQWIKDEAAQSFLRKAERLLGGKPPESKQ